jgi:heat shock protein HtpX
MLSSLLQLALSRAREYNADLGAVEIMGDPEALASALAKMEEYQKRSVRRMFWPMNPKFPEASWLRTHPPTPERIRRLLDIRGNYYDTGNYVDSVSWGGYRVPSRTENRLFVHG